MPPGNTESQDCPENTSKKSGLYIVMISVHGLIRGKDLELGRDADTGGQVKYVVELARALVKLPAIARVDLLTRRISDPQVSKDYAVAREALGDGAHIIRIAAGPDEYIAKEKLWDCLDNFSDNALMYLRQMQRQPDLIHSHYADAGYVGSRLSQLLGVPLLHTGHSLGRVKRRRLLAAGFDGAAVEEKFNISRRIEAEEMTLASAERVITSTHQEIEEQYGRYDYYQPEQMRVIPPGTDLARFHLPDGGEWKSAIAKQLRRFLAKPRKPMILALSRPDGRKNISALLTAYGESTRLQKLANLVIIAGNREDITEMDEGSQGVLTEILILIDRYDLYGKVAYPKHHRPDDVPVIYRLATTTRGVFVNPALTEPFGLTLIEAAASGLPIVATEDGGPRDIVSNCANGLLIDPLNTDDIADKILQVIADERHWNKYSSGGQQGVRQYYSWDAHARSYLQVVRPIVDKTEPLVRTPHPLRGRMYNDKAIFSDIDQNLLGDPVALAQLIRVIKQHRKELTFGIATGRRLDSALKVMKKYEIPEPDVLITSTGTAIHYAPKLTEDEYWPGHIDRHWTPRQVRRILDGLPGLKLQPRIEQSHFKISYYIDTAKAPSLDEINRLLYKEEQTVNVIMSFGQFLDILPIRASKGYALRYFADRWGIPLNHIIVAGGSGADEDMMRGNTLGVIVANRHEEELSQLDTTEQIYFAERPFAAGILEALEHYDFFNSASDQVPA